MLAKHCICAAVFLGVAACAPEPEPKPTYVREPGAATSRSALIAGPALLYLNRCPGGCPITVGPTDARLNQSPIPRAPVTLPESVIGPEDWDELHRCLYEHFDAFDLILVDEEPQTGPYIEAVIAGTPQMMGLSQSVAGISPMDCGFIDRGLNFNFFGAIGVRDGVEGLCAVIAHETGHTIGLDHTYFCSDLMSYLPECGERSFVRADVECGEHGPRRCACDTGELQNSFIGVLRELGPRRTSYDLPPRVRFATPKAPEDTLETEFPIVVEARDDEGTVVRVEASIDGAVIGTLTAPPWVFVAPQTVGLGEHLVEARGFDDRGQVGLAVSKVVVTERTPPWDGGVYDGSGPRPGLDANILEASDAAIGKPLPKTLEEGGCRCLQGATLGGWAWLVFAGLPLLRRRR